MKIIDELEAALKTYKERLPEYKDNYLLVGKALAVMFPNGVELKNEMDHTRYHLFSWMVGKLTRYSTQWEKGGHADSAHDLIVYSAMLAAYDKIEQPQRKVTHVNWGYHSQAELEKAAGELGG